MIRFKKNKDIIILEQEAVPPLVYLDNWVYWNIICEDKAREQFINLFNDDFGTLCLSDTNILEIVKAKREVICKTVEFISQTKFVFFDDNILNDSVIQHRTIKILNKFQPYFENTNELKKIFFDLKITTRRLDNNVNDFIALYKSISKDKIKKERTIDNYINVDINSNYSAEEMSLVWIGYMLYKKKNLKKNDYYDIWHLLKPIVHCDIVTNDSTWVKFINQTFPNLSNKIFSNEKGLGLQTLVEKIKHFAPL